ncbi:MAG: Fe-S cluster assembly protein SufD [Deltaproteobacteria bacterium]|nr:MAG: Fe-S cluster assembly protein SufD [Deltaproteobacteria bacterium]
MSAVEHFREAYQSLAPSLAGAELPWLKERREAALDALASVGFPGRRNEDWKYTSVRWLGSDFAPTVAGHDPGDSIFVPRLETRFDRLVFVDGVFSPPHSRVRAPGITVRPLHKVLAEVEDRLDGSPQLTGAFAKLNTALMDDGAYVEVPSGTAVEFPIELVFVGTGRGKAANVRNLIRVGDGGQATFFERYVGLPGKHFTNAITELSVGEGARVELVRLQKEALGAYHVGQVAVRQAANSVATVRSISVGAELARIEVRVELEGEGAKSDLTGLSLGRRKQHHDQHVAVWHRVGNCESVQTFKSVLDDSARGVFTGMIGIASGADGTDASQSGNNLLLSDDASVQTRPWLEIHADDVKAAHGATVGKLDEDALFYLRQRGLSEKRARSILTYAFANAVLEGANAELAGRLEAVIWEWLGSGEWK